MSTDDIQQEINELVNFSLTSEAAWVAKVQAASIQVVAGAILGWRWGGGLTNDPDPHRARREAAHAILQARLSEQQTASMDRLRQTMHKEERAIKLLTWALVALTFFLVCFGVVDYMRH